MKVDTLKKRASQSKEKGRKMSIETFLKRYRKGKPDIKYEYNKGIIEKTETMKFKEQFILLNLQQQFITTVAFQQKGMLVKELEVWTSENQWRKPDISFITRSQVEEAAEGNEPIQEFVIEVISKNDKINEVKNKVDEYFHAGVKVLWHIFPTLKKVEIYQSANRSETLSGEKICSAEPVINDFTISVNEILTR